MAAASVAMAVVRALERILVPRRHGDAAAGPTQAARGLAIVCSSLAVCDPPHDQGMPDRVSAKPARATTAFS
jgi:hypothetical protein